MSTAAPKRMIFVGIGALSLIAVIVFVIFRILPPDQNSETADNQPDAADSSNAQETLQTLRKDAKDQFGDYIADKWVIQLSSMKPGMEVKGKTLTDEDILDQYEEIKAEHGDAILLWSGDWTSYATDDYWPVVLAEPYDNADEAVQYCESSDYGRDDCFAKRVSANDGPAGTEIYQDAESTKEEGEDESSDDHTDGTSSEADPYADMDVREAMEAIAERVGCDVDTIAPAATTVGYSIFGCDIPDVDHEDHISTDRVKIGYYYDGTDSEKSENASEFSSSEEDDSSLMECTTEYNISMCSLSPDVLSVASDNFYRNEP